MARGIKDKVAILGMGCSKFGERWDSGAEELMLEAYKECISDAGIESNQINAAWFSSERTPTNRIEGRVTASQIAAASDASFFCRRIYGVT